MYIYKHARIVIQSKRKKKKNVTSYAKKRYTDKL